MCNLLYNIQLVEGGHYLVDAEGRMCWRQTLHYENCLIHDSLWNHLDLANVL